MRTCPSTSSDCAQRSVSIWIVVVCFHILFMFLIHVISSSYLLYCVSKCFVACTCGLHMISVMCVSWFWYLLLHDLLKVFHSTLINETAFVLSGIGWDRRWVAVFIGKTLCMILFYYIYVTCIFIPCIIMLLFHITNIWISQFAILVAYIFQKFWTCYLHVIHSTIQDMTHSYSSSHI